MSPRTALVMSSGWSARQVPTTVSPENRRSPSSTYLGWSHRAGWDSGQRCHPDLHTRSLISGCLAPGLVVPMRRFWAAGDAAAVIEATGAGCVLYTGEVLPDLPRPLSGDHS